jgi:GT2 family glycosyltransferase
MKEGKDSKIAKHLKTSVIICTKNRFDDITNCIKSISIQTHVPDEIIIIDSSGNSELKLKLNSLHILTKIPIEYFHINVSLTRARNIGIEKSKGGDIIVFLDDDVILDGHYFEEILKVFNKDKKKSVGGVTGNRIGVTSSGLKENQQKTVVGQLLDNIFLLLKKFFFLPCPGDGKFRLSGVPSGIFENKRIIEVEVLSGCNMAYRREVLNEFKFDENLSGYCFMEDVDFAYRVSRKYKNIYTPFAKLDHNVSTAARDKAYARMKMTIENHHYLFKKNIPQDLKHELAFWWSVIGLVAMAMLGRNKEGLKGLMSGIINIKRNQNKIRR